MASDEKVTKSAFPDLGPIINFHRKKAGLTQLELASLAGIGKTAIFDIENNIKQPRLETVARIFKALNINVRLESPLMKEYEEYRREKS